MVELIACGVRLVPASLLSYPRQTIIFSRADVIYTKNTKYPCFFFSFYGSSRPAFASTVVEDLPDLRRRGIGLLDRTVEELEVRTLCVFKKAPGEVHEKVLVTDDEDAASG